MEARTCRPDIAVGATVILDTYWSRTSARSGRRSIADDISTCSTTYWLPTRHNRQAAAASSPRRPQHVDCARAEHAYRDAEPETQRRSSKSAEINDRDRFKRHARLPGVSHIRMLDVGETRLTGLLHASPSALETCTNSLFLSRGVFTHCCKWQTWPISDWLSDLSGSYNWNNNAKQIQNKLKIVFCLRRFYMWNKALKQFQNVLGLFWSCFRVVSGSLTYLFTCRKNMQIPKQFQRSQPITDDHIRIRRWRIYRANIASRGKTPWLHHCCYYKPLIESNMWPIE